MARSIRSASFRALALLGLAAALCLALPPTGIQASPSGLNLITTADFYEPGVSSLEFQAEADGRPLGGGPSRFALLQFGVARYLEAGVDRSTSEGGPSSFNAKVRLMDGEGMRPALAVGIQNLSRGQRSQPYLVAGLGFGRPLRAHLGAVSLDGAARPMVGADLTWKSLTLQADWIGGRDNSAGVGLTWAPVADLTLTYSLLRPNSGDGADRHVINVQRLLRFW